MREQIITHKELQLAQIQFGAPDLPVILALHGWLDNAMTFAPLAEHLPDFNLCALELPGHGHSDHSQSEAPPHFIDGVLLMMELIDAMKWTDITLMGHSMGSDICSLLAGMIPQKIRRLILIEGLGPITASAETIPEQVERFFRKQKKYYKRALTIYPSMEAMAQVRAQKGVLGIAQARILTERGAIQTEKGWVWRHDPKLYLPSPVRLTEDHVISIFKKITAPACLMMGEQGFRYDQKQFNHRLETIAHIEQHTIPGGHHCHMEYPEAAAKIIRQFCNKS